MQNNKIISFLALATAFSVGLCSFPVYAAKNPTSFSPVTSSITDTKQESSDSRCFSIAPISSVRAASEDITSTEQWQVLKSTNKQRMAIGFWPLSTNEILQGLADIRSCELTAKFSHTRPDGRDCISILDDFEVPYYSFGENIAAGQSSASEVVNSWMNSTGHRENILSPNYTHMGNGMLDKGLKYWTQLFLNTECSPVLENVVSNLTGAGYYPLGTSIDDMSLVLIVSCDNHGYTYIPLAFEMCADFDVDQTGVQDLYFGYNGQYGYVSIALHPFHDVGNDWYTEGVVNAYLTGCMTGLNSTTFGVYDSLSRAQFATILYRLDGSPDTEGTPDFPDVPANDWYTNPVMWASSHEIVTGYTNSGLFGPADNITREQMAVMLKRFADYKKFDTTGRTDFSSFVDGSSVSEFASESMSWAIDAGIITGKNNQTLIDPQGYAARAECAIMLIRFINYYNL